MVNFKTKEVTLFVHTIQSKMVEYFNHKLTVIDFHQKSQYPLQGYFSQRL